MMNREHADRTMTAAIAAVYDAAHALDAGGREHPAAHQALMAARSCILLAAALAGMMDVPGVADPMAHILAARACLMASEKQGVTR